MTLQTKLIVLAQAIGADIKELRARNGVSTMSALGGLGPIVSPGAGVWTLVPLAVDTVVTDNGGADFTRNANGTLTFNKAGTYDVSASLGNSSQAQAQASTMDVRLTTGPAGAAVPGEASQTTVAVERRGATVGEFNIFSLTGTVTVTSGTVLYVWVYSSVSSPGFGVTRVSVGRVGGMKGDKGDPGATPDISAAKIALDTWHTVGTTNEPPFLNSWATNAPGVYGNLRFRKDPFGRVKVQGVVSGGASGSVIFNLPVGYRPPIVRVLDNLQSSGAAGSYIQVDANGDVKGSFTGAPLFIDIDFDTDSVTELSVLAQGLKTQASALDAWHTIGGAGEPTFQNGYANFGSGEPSAAFRKSPNGQVSLRGTITGAAMGVAFTLPVGCRPVGTEWFPIVGAGGLSYISINSAGQITTSSNGVVRLAGIEFDTDTVTNMSVLTNGVFTNPQLKMDKWHTVGSSGEPSFQNGYATAAGEAAVQFQKDPFGKVRMRGTLGGGANGGVAFTLPANYRPVNGRVRNTVINNQTAGGWAQVNINVDGTVNVWYDTLGGVYVALDQIEFDTDTVSDFAILAQGLGGAAISSTLNWNTAIVTGFYRSFYDPTFMSMDKTINGPGDQLNPPPQAGIVTAHPDGTIVQRVWDLYQRRAWTRYRGGDSTWSAWAADLTRPVVQTELAASLTPPEDGEERYFQTPAMKTAGIMWKFRYDASAPSGKPKWVSIGSEPVKEQSQANAAYSTPANAYTWGAALAAPKFTLPLAGDYLIEAVASAQVNGVMGDVRMAPFFNGNAAGLWGAMDELNANGNFSGSWRIDGQAAGTVVDLRFYTSSANATFQVYDRMLKVTPIRVNM